MKKSKKAEKKESVIGSSMCSIIAILFFFSIISGATRLGEKDVTSVRAEEVFFEKNIPLQLSSLPEAESANYNRLSKIMEPFDFASAKQSATSVDLFKQLNMEYDYLIANEDKDYLNYPFLNLSDFEISEEEISEEVSEENSKNLSSKVTEIEEDEELSESETDVEETANEDESSDECEASKNNVSSYLGVKENYSEEVQLLAKIMYLEEGVYADDEEGEYVHKLAGSVVLNRIESEIFPNTVEDVLYAPGQYGRRTKRLIDTVEVPDKVYVWAQEIYDEGPLGPPSLVFQAGFKQGEVYYHYGNQYFCLSDKIS